MIEFNIGGTSISQSNKPFIIAEMSGNHNQSLERALAIVDAAADAGATALKLQTYTADTITLDAAGEDFIIKDESSFWYGKSLHGLYRQAYTPWEWHQPIMDRAKNQGMACFSSPFDEDSVDFLEELNMPAYKIASFENNHLPLIKKVAATGKPMIISTGMATISELYEAVSMARESGCESLALLKCTSSYPASPENSNILTIPHMRELFGCEVGLSDHTMGIGAAIAAVANGASIIEKHFTLSRVDGGVDCTFSMEPNEFVSLVVEAKRAWESLGRISYGVVGSEEKSKFFKRSLYIAENMVAGDQFTVNNLRVVRPGMGLPPKFYEQFLGRRVAVNVQKGTPVTWDLV